MCAEPRAGKKLLYSVNRASCPLQVSFSCKESNEGRHPRGNSHYCSRSSPRRMTILRRQAPVEAVTLEAPCRAFHRARDSLPDREQDVGLAGLGRSSATRGGLFVDNVRAWAIPVITAQDCPSGKTPAELEIACTEMSTSREAQCGIVSIFSLPSSVSNAC